MEALRPLLRIGTSGIVLPGSKETFPAEFKTTSRLSYYSFLFNSLEINSTFHKLPRQVTFTRWSQEASEDFVFTIKLWKQITHQKGLRFRSKHVATFMEGIEHIGKKKGCILVQLPGSIKIDRIERVKKLLLQLNKMNVKSKWKICIEFRDESWYNVQAIRLLNKLKIGRVWHDMPKSQPPEIDIGVDVIYLRFHGPTGNYRGSYAEEFLHCQAALIKELVRKKKAVFVYFNNTMGAAFDNAMFLQKHCR